MSRNKMTRMQIQPGSPTHSTTTAQLHRGSLRGPYLSRLYQSVQRPAPVTRARYANPMRSLTPRLAHIQADVRPESSRYLKHHSQGVASLRSLGEKAKFPRDRHAQRTEHNPVSAFPTMRFLRYPISPGNSDSVWSYTTTPLTTCTIVG
jgi:hypothetical protein